jgi:tetratricopeptide (TPR) repeat protein
VLFYLVWRSHKKGKEVIFGMSFFLVTIILVLQILPVGNAMMADRYTYVPYIGIFFIAGKFIENLMLSNEKNISQKGRFVFVITLLLALVFTIASRQRVEKWENDEVLFTDVIKKYPDCSIAYINKGWYYYNYLSEYVYKNNFSQRKKYIYKAIDDFNNAIKYAVSPETKVKAYYNSATAKAACNRHKEALQEFNAALEIDPEYYVIYINRANTEIALNDFEKAMEDLNIAVEKLPDSPIAWNSRAKIKGLQGDYKGALIDASKAIELDPYFVEAYNNRANAKSALNDKTAALQDYNKAIELNPNFDQLYVNRGIVKKEIGDINGAFADFNKAIELNPDNNIARQWLYNIEKFQ